MEHWRLYVTRVVSKDALLTCSPAIEFAEFGHLNLGFNQSQVCSRFIVVAACAMAAPPQVREEPPKAANSVAKESETTKNVGNLDSPTSTLTVRVVDGTGAPITNADVLLYDEHNVLAGLERRFDNVLMRTNDRGECDFGRLPLEHVAVLVRRRKGEFHESVVHLFTHDPVPRLSTNRLVQLETNGNEIIITHTMRQGVDLMFDVVDSVTKKPVQLCTYSLERPCDAAVDQRRIAGFRWATQSHHFGSRNG